MRCSEPSSAAKAGASGANLGQAPDRLGHCLPWSRCRGWRPSPAPGRPPAPSTRGSQRRRHSNLGDPSARKLAGPAVRISLGPPPLGVPPGSAKHPFGQYGPVGSTRLRRRPDPRLHQRPALGELPHRAHRPDWLSAASSRLPWVSIQRVLKRQLKVWAATIVRGGLTHRVEVVAASLRDFASLAFRSVLR